MNDVLSSPNRLISEAEAAQYLGLAPRTIQGLRYRGTGPVFIKLGHRTVKYRVADLDTWNDSHAHTNTSGGRP